MHQNRNSIVPPPRRGRLTSQLTSQQIYRAFPIKQREQILRALIGVVAQQLAKPRSAEEVAHERS